MESIGPYQIISTIGKGGMGEVFLAFDPLFKRQIALKRIRKDLKNYDQLKERFLKEASITGQLTHPGIIAIFTIHLDPDQIYYTMPYVEGKNLKQLLRQTREELRQAERLTKDNGSIPALIRIFFAICQAVSYAHSKSFIHRDLKPENVLVGTYGEVVILDWGLAQSLDEPQATVAPITIEVEDPQLTLPGKLVGTLAYLAPERAFDKRSTFQTDIYALGVILYQLLTLRMPFQRSSLKEFRKIAATEKLTDPEEAAPYRDVPPRLSRIAKKCLDPKPAQRYQNMEELLQDLTGYLEGRSDWFQVAEIDIHNKEDWEFQENVLISRHIALTHTTVAADWVSIMISKASFTGNIRLTTRLKIGDLGQGIGFLLSAPEASDRKHPQDGYCLWLAATENSGAILFRNSIEVLQVPDLFLKKNQWYEIHLEKVDNNIYCWIDDVHRFSFISYLPLMGTHVGILSQDANYTLLPLCLAVGSLNLQVSCLAIPDAFLANNDYTKALAEYRRIAYSFPGHAEGREALFRAGITLLEQAKSLRKAEVQEFFHLSLEEFAKLHSTPGAPLEYLGQALVYESMQEFVEEIKCLEFALRRYKNHPLISPIKEQVIYRMHESSQRDRYSAYSFILIALRHLPDKIHYSDSRRLFRHLVAHWETLPFLDNPVDPTFLVDSVEPNEKDHGNLAFATALSFWLAAPFTLGEIFQELIFHTSVEPAFLGNILFSLIELGSYEFAQKLVDTQKSAQGPALLEANLKEYTSILTFLEPLFICHRDNLENAIKYYLKIPLIDVGIKEFRTACYLMQQAILTRQEAFVDTLAAHLNRLPISMEDHIQIDAYRIWAYLSVKNWQAAENIFRNYPLEMLNQESTLLHPLFGCWLYVAEGEEIAFIHFAGVVDTPYPRTWALLSHQLVGKLTETAHWQKNSFLWERRHLYRQLTLFYQCSGQKEQEMFARHLEKQEYTLPFGEVL